MRNAGLEEAQAGIKIAGRKINNLRYADDTTFMTLPLSLLPPHPLQQWDCGVLPTGPLEKSPGRGTQQEEERLQFFPGKNSAKEKIHGLFVYYNPPNFFFLSLKMFSFPCWVGT